MNYQKIHDCIINRALSRKKSPTIKYESHHIIPKCEGGLQSGDTILLTKKEHRIIHKLRYKVNGVLGNILSYNLIKFGREMLCENHKLFSIKGGQQHHKIYREKNFSDYIDRQKKSGIIGGNKCKDEKLGFFSFSEEELNLFRKKGRDTLVKNKLGMFSDEYRKKHKLTIQKRIKTPDRIFNSMKEASEFYGVVQATITYRVNNKKWNDWFYINEEGENCE